MAYFKINNIDFSQYVSQLKVQRKANYNSQTNAAGDSVVDYLNHKRTFDVGIITIDSESMIALQNVLANLNVSISYRDPMTGELVENVNCILPTQNVEYYTIQTEKVLYKEFNLKFTEL